uniref:Uncharacterized protein n=1 Tax=Aegilops tauschii subsp. strangulata TaxID=200361 RepID=A0A453N007_AEGTS
MSDLDLVAYINEENKRRKRRRIVLTKLHFESFLLGIAYLSTQRAPRDLGSFSDDEEKNIHRKYLLKGLYDGAEANKKVGFYKNKRTGDAILCLLGDMKGSFNDALKSLEPLPLPQVTPPAEILATLEMIPDLARGDILRSYGKLILSERLYQALLELPMNFRKEWLLM